VPKHNTEKKRMAKLLKASGEIESVEPKNGKGFQLRELYDLLDCNMVQVCEASEEGKILIFDEEFLCKNEPVVNAKATDKMAEHMMPYVYNVICGNAILCNDAQFA
jgi:hypothetical protein